MQGTSERRGRRVKWIVGAVVAVPLAAVVAAYLVFFTPSSPPELRLSTRVPDPAYAVPTGVWSVGSGYGGGIAASRMARATI